jgi:hypothetical protein
MTGIKSQKPLSMTVTVQTPRALTTGLESAKVHDFACGKGKPTPKKKEGHK